MLKAGALLPQRETIRCLSILVHLLIYEALIAKILTGLLKYIYGSIEINNQHDRSNMN